MDRKPFEIIAECQMAGLPTGADIGRISEQIEAARRSQPEIVRAVAKPPAIYKDRQYVLQTVFVVWADDSARASETVAGLLQDAGIPYRTVVPSGRALTEADVPPPPKPEKPGRTTLARRTPSARRRPRTRKRR